MIKRSTQIIISIMIFLSAFTKGIYADSTITEVYVNIRPFAYSVPFISNIDISYDADYSATLDGYYDASSDTKLNPGDPFVVGKDYYVLITFTPEAGFNFDAALTCKVNGQDATRIGSTYQFKYTMQAIEFNQDNIVKLRLEKNDGSGRYEELDAVKGAAFSLSNEYFETPIGMSLVGWSVNGVKYNRGSQPSIYPLSDTTVSFIYEKGELVVSGILVDIDSNADVLGDGSVLYEASSATLTLKNASLMGDEIDGIYNSAIYATGPLNIKLEGNNVIQEGNTSLKNSAIYVEDDLSISDGVLKIENSATDGDVIGIEVLGNLNLSNMKLDIDSPVSTYIGIHTSLDCDINNSDVRIELGKQDVYVSMGMNVGKDLKILESSLDLFLDDAFQQIAISIMNDFTSTDSTIKIKNKSSVTTQTVFGIYLYGEANLENSLLKIELEGENADVTGIMASYITLKDLKDSLIQADSSAGIGLSSLSCIDDSIQLLKGEYVIKGGKAALNLEPVVDVKDGFGLFYADNYEGNDQKLWNNESLLNLPYLQTGHVHDYEHLKYDDQGHWKECDCGEKKDFETHADLDNDGKCDDCLKVLKEEKPSVKVDYVVVNTGIKR